MDSFTSSPTPLPSLAPSAAPSPLPTRRQRRPTFPGDIGWGLNMGEKMTEIDFLRDVDPSISYGRKMGLHFTHIPAEMKREYFLLQLQGSQTLPSPNNIDSAPASPSFDRRFYRRNGSGTSAPSDLAALRCSDQILQTQRTFDRRIPTSPSAVRPNTSFSSAGGHSKVGNPQSRGGRYTYKGMGVRGNFQAQPGKSNSSSGSSTPGRFLS